MYHADVSRLRGGFVGVDIFFVISGYLITSILFAEHATGTFSLVGFYERRARRILPALFVVVIACVPCAWLWLLPADRESFWRSLVAVSAFASNILFYKSTGYFEAAAEWKPLLHTWSLAVEEQYYLIFPLLLWVAWRLGRPWVVGMLVSATVASLAVAQWTSIHDPAATFYLLPSRGWELLVGALVAAYMASRGRWLGARLSIGVRQVAAMVGLLSIGYAVVAFDKKTPHAGLYALAPTLGAALIILFATAETWAGKLLGTEALVRMGLISYSAYLWHWPLFVFARHKSVPRVPSGTLMAALVGASLLMGYLSWRYIERPFRDRRKVLRRGIFTLAALGTASLLAMGVVGHLVNIKGHPGKTSVASARPTIEFLWLKTGGCMYQPGDDLPVGAKGVECWVGDKTSSRTAIMLGDSYAGAYDALWDIVGKKSDLRINSVTTNWCMPTRNEAWMGRGDDHLKQCLFDRRFFADNVSKYDVAILGGNWMAYSTSSAFDGVLDLIDFAAKRTKVVVVMAAPKQFDVSPVEAYDKSLLEKKPFDINAVSTGLDAEEARANRLLEEASKKYENVLYVDRDSLFSIEGVPSDVTRDNVPFSLEGNHISGYGSKAAAASFLESQKYKDLLTMLQSSSR